MNKLVLVLTLSIFFLVSSCGSKTSKTETTVKEDCIEKVDADSIQIIDEDTIEIQEDSIV